MRLRWSVYPICILAIISIAASQEVQSKPSPDHGEFVGTVYTNGFFGMKYTLPEGAGWYVNDELMNQDASRPNKMAGRFLLTVLDRHTAMPMRERVMMMADDAGLYHPPLKSTREYVAKLTDAQSKLGCSITRRADRVEYGGRQFYRGDFQESYPGGVLYKSFVATKSRGFLVSWTFVSNTAEGLEGIVNTLSQLTFAATALRPAKPSPPAKVPSDVRSIRISQMTLEKFILDRPVPAYPEEAKRMGIEGPVCLRVHLSKTGEVAGVQVVEGHPALTQAALDAVRYWKFRPYVLNGEPVDVESQIIVNFRLSNPRAVNPNQGR